MGAYRAGLPVSVVVMTRDEAANIGACLESLKGAFDDVHVVDSDSRDETASLALAKGAQVRPFRWNGRYPKKKQWCLETLSLAHEWVLFLDADERATPGFIENLRSLFAGDEPEASAYFVSARLRYQGRLLRFGRRHRKIALMRRGDVQFPAMADLNAPGAWEVEGHYQPGVAGSIGSVRTPIEHIIPERLANRAKHDRYANWHGFMEAAGSDLIAGAADTSYRRLIKRVLRTVPWARPGLAFADSYLIRLGFLDGLPGLRYAQDRYGYYRALAAARTYWQAERARQAGAEEPCAASATAPAGQSGSTS